MPFDNKVMVFQVATVGCVWKTSFHKSGHILSRIHNILVIEKIKNFKTSRDWLTYKN